MVVYVVKVVIRLDINKRIISLRERKNWSQKELAQKLNINPSVMNRIESGERPIKDAELYEMALLFGCSADYILGINRRTYIKEPTFFENEPYLEQWYYDLPASNTSEVKQLYRIWEALKK